MRLDLKHIKFLHFVLAVVLSMAIASPALSKEKKRSDGTLSSLKSTSADDEKNSEIKALKAELFIAAQEEKAIQQNLKLLKKYRGTALEPDLLMRLAELYMRRSKTDRFLEVHRNSEEVVNVAPKLVKSAASRKQIQSAIDLFDQIERRFPSFDRLDVVIFNNGFANQQIGQDSKSEKKYAKLVREFPGSVLLPDAHLALGEIQFRNREFKKALAHFHAIREYPDSLVYPYGIYKAAWTQYNLRDAEAGLKELEDVIRYGRFVKEQGIDARLDLRKEALMDMALFYEDVRPSKSAYGYFEKQAGELDASPVVLRLADLYKRHSRHSDIKVILTDLIRKKPTSNYVPIAYVELMDASEKMKKRRDVVTLLGQFFSTCDVKSQWSRSQAQDLSTNNETPLAQFNEEGDPKITPSQICQRVFNKMALGYANKWLKLWEKNTAQAELADVTEQAFSIYLRSDAKSEESARARFVYAELLFKRTKFREASENYAIVSQITKDKAIGHDSRYYALIALEKAVNDKFNDKDEKLFRSLSTEYLTKNKDGKFLLDVEFKLGFIAYQKSRYDEAAPIFKRLGSQYAQTEKGLKAQDLYLDILNIKKDYSVLRDYSQSLRGSAKGDRVEKLTKIYEEAYFLIVQSHEEKKDYQGAIDQYEKFARENPKSALTQKALWNALQLQFKSGELMAGAKSSVAYFEKYPTSKDGLNALMKAAQTYESLGQLRLAADVLVRLSQVDKEETAKWKLLAADFYVLSNDLHKARPLYEGIKKGKEADSSFRALEQLEMVARRENNEKLRLSYLKEIIGTGRQPQSSLAAIEFAEGAFNEKRYEEAFSQAKKIISQEKSGAAKSSLARARLIQARILAKEFRDQSVKSRLERVQIVLTLKTEKLAKAQVAYQSAAQYGDPLVAVLAYNELADCYLHYSESLNNMPLPAGVPEEEASIFTSEMNKLAIPMEEKGIETKLQAYSVAKQLGVHDQVVSQIQQDLKKLNQPLIKSTAAIGFEPASIVLPRLEGVGT